MNSAYLSKLCRTSSSSRTCRVVVFGCFDGAFRSAKRFPPFGVRDALRPALQAACSDCCTRAKHGHASCVTGGSDPTELWAAESAQKWGSIKGGCQEKTLPLPQGEERFSDIELPPKIAR